MVAILLWTAGIVMVRPVPMSGIQIAFWRILLGAVVYVAILRMRGRTLTMDQIRASAAAGVTISIEIAVFFVAIKLTTVANTTIISALQPIVLLAVASRRFGERVTGWVIRTALVAVVGVALVAIGSSSQPAWSPRGDALAVVAMLFFAAYFATSKAARETVPALEFQTAVWVVGSVVLLPVALIDGGGLVVPSAGNWLWLAALLAVPGTGHLFMNWAHSRVALSVTSMLTLATPVLATIGAALFLDEAITAIQVAGFAVVLTALAATVRRDARLRAAPAT